MQQEITKLKRNENTIKEEKLQEYQQLLKENESLVSQKVLDAKKYEVEMSLKIKTIQKEKDSLSLQLSNLRHDKQSVETELEEKGNIVQELENEIEEFTINVSENMIKICDHEDIMNQELANAEKQNELKMQIF